MRRNGGKPLLVRLRGRIESILVRNPRDLVTTPDGDKLTLHEGSLVDQGLRQGQPGGSEGRSSVSVERVE